MACSQRVRTNGDAPWGGLAHKGRDPQWPLDVCAVPRRRFPVGASPTRRTPQPDATGAVMEVTKWLKPSVLQVTASCLWKGDGSSAFKPKR
jgi:hypothetical protein